MLAFLDSPIQLLVAVVVILIVFGPQKLPEIFNQLGRAMREFKRATSDLSSSLNVDDRYNMHYEPPRYDSYGNAVDTTSESTVPEEDIRSLPASDNHSQQETSTSEPPRGDFAASALADTAEEYGTASGASATAPAAERSVYGVMPAASPQEIQIRPAEGAVPRKP